MAIDPFKDELIDLREVPSQLPGRVSLSTLFTWWKYGVGNVRLETVKVGRQRYTTREALAEFFRQRTALDVIGATATDAERSPELTEQLRAAGLL